MVTFQPAPPPLGELPPLVAHLLLASPLKFG
jgi:hypothetical protein